MRKPKPLQNNYSFPTLKRRPEGNRNGDERGRVFGFTNTRFR